MAQLELLPKVWDVERDSVECEQLDLENPRDFVMSSVDWGDLIVCVVDKMFVPHACTPEFEPRNPQ